MRKLEAANDNTKPMTFIWAPAAYSRNFIADGREIANVIVRKDL